MAARLILIALLTSWFGFSALLHAQEGAVDDDDGSPCGSILKGEHRNPKFILRDQYRHPLETLKFFGVESGMTVVEIWPGKGWYTEVLAPLLMTKDASAGIFYTAHFPTGIGVDFYDNYQALFVKKLAMHPNVYGDVKMAAFDPKRGQLTVPEGSADAVLTFRNVHNWLRSESEATAFNLFYKALKPGGILGVVEHRAPKGTDWETMKTSGYMTEEYVIDLATKAGFVLDEKSEINSNAKDTKNHPKGVWTLPPTLRLKDQGRDKYLAIGESDRMTLKFKKPK